MNPPPFIKGARLEAAGAIHGFFSRAGGVSKGVYASLNTGPGSGDDPVCVEENRHRCALALGLAPSRLVTLHQVHSADVVCVREPWMAPPPEADAMVTNEPGLALGILTADCMPFLFYDVRAGVIGAAHAGWRGALSGVLEATIAAMVELGATPKRIIATLGPCLRQPNFEVGMDLVDTFMECFPQSNRFFSMAPQPDKRLFDLAGFGFWRLHEQGLAIFDDAEMCTLAQPADYFSYRATRRAGDKDYGRNLSAIALQSAEKSHQVS